MRKMHKLQVFTRVVICFLIICSSFCLFVGEKSKADSNNIYVNVAYLYSNGDGSADRPYRSIQQAINAANNEDHIFVFEGTYNETIVIDKQISLMGLDRDNTIISRGGASHRNLIEINADYVTFEHFTVTDVDTRNLVALMYVTSDYVSLHSNKITESLTWGMYFDSSSDNTIGNNIISGTKGIRLVSSNNNVFSNNDFEYCKETAIQLSSSNSNIVYDNSIDNSKFSILSQSSSNNKIIKNVIEDSDIDGIKISGGSNNAVENNTITSSGSNGVFLTSSDSKIVGNKLDTNQQSINLDGSDCLIYNNSIKNSQVWGVYTSPSSSGNVIYLNYFLGNTVNAKAYGDNQWYYEGQGNYWDDYKEVDKDLDKIGDTPYSKGGVWDPYPLGSFLVPPQKPDNPSPSDEAEDVGLSITLSVNVNDVDSDLVDVYFYRASDDKLYGTDYDVQSGSTASCNFILPFETTFLWYAEVTDGRLENRSDIWIFTTRQIPPLNEQPVANPGGPYTSVIGEEITFDGSGSHDPDGTIDFYRWSFGDGSSQILSISPTHSYSNAGTYIVALTVVDNNGRSSTETTNVIVSASSPNIPPDASINVLSFADAFEDITFDGSDSIDNDGMILNYTWDFGDGNLGYGSLMVHDYVESGTYTVMLTVVDDNGDSDITSTTITVDFSVSEENPFFTYLIPIIISIVILVIAVVGVIFWRRLRE